MEAANTPTTPQAPALARGLILLETLAASKHGLTISQIARQVDCAKSSVHRLVNTLERYGYIYRETRAGRYRLSLHLCDLANMALNGVSLRDYARPHLAQLAAQTGLTIHLAVLEQGSAVLIEKIESPRTVRVATWIGKQLGLHCTALGKALMAHMNDAQIDELLLRHGMLRYNENTICSVKKLKESLAVIRRRGYALDDEEEEIGVRCIGAPILNESQEPVAALSVVGRTGQVYPENFSALAHLVMAAAQAISDRFRKPEIPRAECVPLKTRPENPSSAPSVGFHADRAS